jgi:lambda repressor-like predicted transcriptional regulator
MIAAAPLRSATVWCVELRPGRPVTISALATIAVVEPSRAKAYASILLARGALIETDAGLLPGPAWDAWRAEPGGRPKRSAADSADDMDAMRRAMAANVRKIAAERGWSQRELSRRSGTAVQAINRLMTRSVPLPATACVLVARALGVTVEHLVSPTASFRG